MLKEKILNKFADITLQVFRRSTYGYYASRLHLNPDILRSEDLVLHFGHLVMNEVASQYVVGGLIIDRIQFIYESLGEKAIFNETFLDVGDTDGIFLKSLHKTGISANISETVVNILTKKGYTAVRCDTEWLPFRDESVDHILFFAILEHVTNPIQVLTELHRVAKKSVFISIASMTRTNIHKYMCFPDNPPYEQHVFEFSDEDFRKIITHAGFSVKQFKKVSVFLPERLLDKILLFVFSIVIPHLWKDKEYKNNKKDILFGCFRCFGLYYLEKNNL